MRSRTRVLMAESNGSKNSADGLTACMLAYDLTWVGKRLGTWDLHEGLKENLPAIYQPLDRVFGACQWDSGSPFTPLGSSGNVIRAWPQTQDSLTAMQQKA